MTVEIRAATSDADLADLATLVNAVTPDDPTSLEEMRWADATYPGNARFLAMEDGRAVGAATVGRIYVYPPEHPDLWASVVVAPEARGRGIGSELLGTVSMHATGAGKIGLQCRAWEHRPEGITFLVNRGFRELERGRMVSLDLAGLPLPVVAPPADISITTLADRPDLVGGVHAVASEAFDDIPGGDTPMAAGDLAEFRARDVDRPGIPPGAFMIAVEQASDEVIGYASLMLRPGSTTVAWHDMTAVRRAWRGRGIATVLKLAIIDWAIRHGLSALETGNDEDNAGMRAINARLGYRPLPDELTMRGPLLPTGASA